MAKHRSLFPLIVSALGLLGACSSETTGSSSYTLIDDMEGTGGNVIAWVPPGETAGGWWTTTDCTQADRIAPPPFNFGLGGWTYDSLPAPHETADGVESRHAARLHTLAPLSGIWGAIVGFNFLEALPLNSSASPAPAEPGAPCRQATWLDFTGRTVDLGAYSGVTFWAMAARPLDLKVKLRDRNTDPRGGFCNAANPAVDDGCYNDFSASVVLTDAFAKYTIDFSTLAQDPAWGVRSDSDAVDLQRVYAMLFQVDLPLCTFDGNLMCAGGSSPPLSFDIRIDDLYFVNRAP